MGRHACSAATCRFFSFLLLLLPCLFSSQVHASQLNTTQAQIVKRIFNTIRLYMSPYKFLNTTAADPCAWRGVTCYYYSYVTSETVIYQLSFSDLGIAFNNSTALNSFFSLICSLDTLVSLNLSSNHLTSIPGAFFSSCTGLFTLDLSQNSLSEKIPSQLSNLTNLSHLYLNGNNFSGSIPSPLTNMSLYDLQLGDNKLSGTIPIISCSIEILNLSRNSFGGPILSSTFDDSINLGVLDLSHNNFSGSVPNSLNLLAILTFLDLSYNNLSGEVPLFAKRVHLIFEGSRNLKILDLSHNNFSGSVPTSLTELQYLQFLDLSYNNLSGELPIFNKRVNLVITGNNLSPNIIDSNSKSGSEISTVSLVVIVGSFVNGMVAY